MSSEIDVKGMLGTIRRQFWLILTTVVLISLLSCIFAYGLTSKFTATALVLIDASPQTLLDPQTRAPTTTTDNGKIESEATILASDSVMIGAMRSQNLVADPEFGVKLGLRDKLAGFFGINAPGSTAEAALGSVLRSFKRAVSIKRAGLTSVIEVSVTSANPAKAAALANALTSSYVNQQVEAKIASIVAARNILQARVESASAAIAQNETSFDQYLSQNVRQLEANGGGPITALQEQLAAIENTRIRELARMDLANQSLQQGNFQSAVAALGSDALAELGKKQASLQAQLAGNATGAAQLTDIRQRLDEVNASIRQKVPVAIEDSRSAILKKAQEDSTKVREELRTAILSSTDDLPPEKLTEIYALQRASDIARKQYDALLTRLKDLDTQSNLQLADSRVVSPALVPSIPSSPHRPLIIGLAAIGSVLLGLGMAIVREHFIGGFVDENQVEDVLRIPLASVAPSYAPPTQALSVSDGVVSSPLSIYSESIRRLRANLDHAFRGADIGGKVIMISSAVPAEGKSTLSLSLARIYALSGKKTLLIDCDLRKPSIHRHLGLPSDMGLIDYLGAPLSEGVPLSKLLVSDPKTDLNVLLGGQRSDVPTDAFFTDARMTRLIASARKHFDYVIMDTPPIDPVVDGLYIAPQADALAFVIKWASTSQTVAKRSLAALAENKQPAAPILAVLSQQDQTKMGGNSRYSDYYSE